MNINEDSTFRELFLSLTEANAASDNTNLLRMHRLIHYAPEFWNKPWKDIKKADMIAWRSKMEKTELSTTTKNYIIAHVKQVSKHAYIYYDLPDVAKYLIPFRAKLDEYHEMQIITYENFRRMISNETNQEIKDFLIFLFMTGMRRGEARALYPSDYDSEKKAVHIFKSMRRYESSLKTTKTGTDRWVMLDDATDALLQPYIKRNAKYIFGAKEGEKPLGLSTVASHFSKDAEKAGLPHYKIHALRHSNVSLLWNAGVPVPEISKRVGHRSPMITMEIYAHIMDIQQHASVNALNELVKK